MIGDGLIVFLKSTRAVRNIVIHLFIKPSRAQIQCTAFQFIQVNVLNSWHGDQFDQSSQSLMQEITKSSFKKIQPKMEACQNILQLNIQIYKCTFNKYNMTYS